MSKDKGSRADKKAPAMTKKEKKAAKAAKAAKRNGAEKTSIKL